MPTQREQLKDRTKQFALRVVRLFRSLFWLEMLMESDTVKEHRTKDLLSEGQELAAIFAASHQTARGKAAERQPGKRLTR